MKTAAIFCFVLFITILPSFAEEMVVELKNGRSHSFDTDTIQKVYFKNKSPERIESNNFRLRFGEEKSIFVPNNGYTKMRIIGRIIWKEMAGATYALRASVNNKILDQSRVINKAKNLTIRDGRSFPWYSNEYSGWSLMYSPDLIANKPESRGYGRTGYQVVDGGDPYETILSLNGLLTQNNNIVIIKNNVDSIPNFPYRDLVIELKYIFE